jgi:DNA-binding transcriptional regulator YiaG
LHDLVDIASALCHGVDANQQGVNTMQWHEFAETAERLEGKHWRSKIAKRLGRSPSTIWRWERKGAIPKTAEGAVLQLLAVQPQSQSDMIADAIVKALNIKMIG